MKRFTSRDSVFFSGPAMIRAVADCRGDTRAVGAKVYTADRMLMEVLMFRSVLNSMAVAALALSIGTASAQVAPGASEVAALSPEQRTALRTTISERLADELRSRLPERLGEAVDAESSFTPAQRTAIRTAIRARLSDDVREGLAEKLSARLSERLGTEVPLRAGILTPEQRAALRNAINERLGDDMRESISDRVADASAAAAKLSPAQRAALLALLRAKLADEIRSGLGDRIADAITKRLADKTIGSGAR